MKRTIIIIGLLSIFLLPSAQAAIRSYGATGLIGGTTGCLDKINGASLNDGDVAEVKTSSGVYFYVLNATSGAAESSPDVIAPDTNAGLKRWIRKEVHNGSLTAASATISGATTTDTLQLSAGTSANEISTDTSLAGDSDDAVPTERAVKTYVDANTGLPPGMIMAWPVNSEPAGWFECDGSDKSMTTYENLYDLIKNDYGLNTGTTVTFTNGTNTINASAHGLSNDAVIELSNSGGALPAELADSTKYFVVNAGTNTFQVSTTQGGTAVSFTDDGTGTSYFHGSFKVPDYRGYFLRGWDNTAGNDPDSASRADRGDGTTGDNIGTKQADELKSHTHSVHQTVLSAGGYAAYTISVGSTSSIPAAGGSESRPKNVNVMWIIKY
jgi:hypothetical protein